MTTSQATVFEMILEEANARFLRPRGSNVVAEGTYSWVTRLWDTRCQRSVVSKTFRTAVQAADRQAELVCWRKAGRQPNIVKVLAVGIMNGVVQSIYSEYLEQSLDTRWTTLLGLFSFAETAHVITKIALGVRHLQERHIWHRDLGPSNVLLHTRMGGLRVCLADLGLARCAPSSDASAEPPGLVSEPYRAPEISMGMDYGAPVDMELGLHRPGNANWHSALRPATYSPLLYAMRICSVITPENLPECERATWIPAPKNFQTFWGSKDFWVCSLPEPCTDIARGLLELRPNMRWTLTATVSALDAVRVADASRKSMKRRCSEKVTPDTPWQEAAHHDAPGRPPQNLPMPRLWSRECVHATLVAVRAGPTIGARREKQKTDTGEFEPSCRLQPVDGFTKCVTCKCCVPDCDKARYAPMRTCYKHRPVDPKLKLEVRALMRFQASLKEMMLVDVAGVLTYTNLGMPAVILAIAFQLWEPFAVCAFVRFLALAKCLQTRRCICPVVVRDALWSAIRTCAKLLVRQDDEGARYRYHLDLLEEQGACCRFGAISQNSRPGVLAVDDGAKSRKQWERVTLGVSRSRCVLLPHTSGIKVMCERLPQVGPPPNRKIFCVISTGWPRSLWNRCRLGRSPFTWSEKRCACFAFTHRAH